MSNKLQAAIESICVVLAATGAATARQIEAQPDVVNACRALKWKARVVIKYMQGKGVIHSDGSLQCPRYRLANQQCR